jgi:hypothetical protein
MRTTEDLRQAQRPAPPGDTRPPVLQFVAVIVVVAALVAAAVWLLRASGSPEPLTTNATPVTSPPSVPVTTLAPPALATTGDNPDWPALVRSIMAYDYWLKTHPDPARQADIFTADYRTVMASGEVITLASAQADLAMLARGDIRYDPAPNEVTAAIVTMQNRDATSASVFVRLNPSKGNRTVGRDGTVHQFPDRASEAVIWRLVLGSDGRWRLAGVKSA